LIKTHAVRFVNIVGVVIFHLTENTSFVKNIRPIIFNIFTRGLVNIVGVVVFHLTGNTRFVRNISPIIFNIFTRGLVNIVGVVVFHLTGNTSRMLTQNMLLIQNLRQIATQGIHAHFRDRHFSRSCRNLPQP
jgi:hypothetical protein